MKTALIFCLLSATGVFGEFGTVNNPDSLRVEVEITRLENDGSIQADGQYCHYLSKCYPSVDAYLDVATPASPVDKATAGGWPVIFTAASVNSPNIGKSLNRSICGIDTTLSRLVNLRVHVTDSSSTALIANFACAFNVGLQNIGGHALSTPWGPETECTSPDQPGKIRLFARVKPYLIDSPSCWAASNAWSSSNAGLLLQNSASGSGANSSAASSGSWNPLHVVNAVVGAGTGGAVGAGVGAVSGGVSGSVLGGKSGAEQGAAAAGDALGSVGDAVFGSVGKSVFGTVGKVGGGAVGGVLGFLGGAIAGTTVGGVKGVFTGTGEGAKAGKESFNPFAGTIAGVNSGVKTGVGAGQGVDKVITGSDTNVPKIAKRSVWIHRSSLSEH